MEGSKVVKAICPKTGKRFSLEVVNKGGEYKVVDFTPLSKEQAERFASEVRQDRFVTADSLIPCRFDGIRVVGSSPNVERGLRCNAQMGYQFNCIYCKELQIDYSAASYKGRPGEKIVLPQGKVVEITFANVEWKKFDEINFHDKSHSFVMEPKVHVSTSEKKIEFHGYNVSAMNEGVYYDVGAQDDFSIECDVDTSTISPHPGGFLYIDLGIIQARIDQTGGEFRLDGASVARVGSKFHMRLSISGGTYSIELPGEQTFSRYAPSSGKVRVKFGFQHGSHYCELLSHAYISDIRMNQRRVK